MSVVEKVIQDFFSMTLSMYIWG